MFKLKKIIQYYSGDLKSGLGWIPNGQKKVDLQIVRISDGIWNPESQPVEFQTNSRIMLKTIWNLEDNIQIQMVWFSNWKLDHLKSDLQKVRISNVSVF